MDRLAKWLLIALLSILLLAGVQQVTHVVHTHPLDGAFHTPEYFSPSVQSILDESFQLNTLQTARYSFGFRPDVVRLANEIDYQFFGKLNTILTVGKEDYLFDPNYTAAYEGRDLMDDGMFEEMIRGIIRLDSALWKNDVQLLIVLPPNKSMYYKEYLPTPPTPARSTNKSRLVASLEAYSIDYIDAQLWFESLTQERNKPLIPMHGAHWSQYGAILVFDSLLNWMDRTRPDFTFAKTEGDIEYTNKARYPDDDYNASLNLINRLSEDTLCYPEVHYTTPAENKITLRIIGDSFAWNWYYISGFSSMFNPESRYYYYNTTVYDFNRKELGSMSDCESCTSLEDLDVLIVVVADPNIPNFLMQFSQYWNHKLEHGF